MWMFGSIFSGEADGVADLAGICIPGMCMFGSIFSGEGDGAADFAGICIPGILAILCLFAGFFFAAVFFLLDAGLRRGVPDIFIPGIPGMFMPGMLPMSCFFAVCFFRTTFLFFRVVAFALDFAFGLLIPGMLDISCCARTGKLAANRKVEKTSAQTLIRKRNLVALTFFIIPLQRLIGSRKSFDGKTTSAVTKRFGCLSENEQTRFNLRNLKRQGGN
jgi:hypothetical protein